MGMSITLSAPVVLCLHERGTQTKSGLESGNRCVVSVPPVVGQFSSIVKPNSRSSDSLSDVSAISSRKWCRENLKTLLSGDQTRTKSRNGLEMVHGLGRSLGLRISGRSVRPQQATKHKCFLVRAAGDQNGNNTTGDDPVETLFMRELRRRGISSDSKGSAGTDTRTKPTDDDDSGLGPSEIRWSQKGEQKTKPPPQWTAPRHDDQLKRSMALNSEGLEGLIPRATELLKLGGTFWIMFWPLILASLATFITLYVYLGPSFLHSGNSIYPGGRPPYIEPYQLLEEESIPPEIGPDRVPFRSNSTP